MTTALEVTTSATGQDQRQIPRVVFVAVAHAATEQHECAVEQGPVALWNRLKPVQEIGHHGGVIGVDFRLVGNLLRVVAVVRDGVESFRYANFRISATAQLASQHERRDPCQISLEGEDLQVEHQLGVSLERVGNAGRLQHLRHLTRTLFFGQLDTPLDTPDRLEILVQRGPVLAVDRAGDTRHFLPDRVEDAGALPPAGQSDGRVRGATLAEQPFEHEPGVVLHRQRAGGSAPGERVRIHTGEAGVAGAAELG